MNIEIPKNKELEQQFQELLELAKNEYPDIETTLANLDNITAQTAEIQDYLNLTMQTPQEISTNQISHS